MRRLILLAAGLGLLAVFTGCNHKACECDQTPTIASPSVHTPTFNGPPVAAPEPLAKPEPLKELPGPDKAPDKAPDKVPDKAPDKVPDKVPDKD
jgi:hypothetical protein